jgi:hypothetical protein
MTHKALPWLFLPTLIALGVSFGFADEYDHEPWTELGVILAFIGIGLSISIFAFQSIQQAKLESVIKQIDGYNQKIETEKAEKKTYVEKMIVTALVTTRQQVRKISKILFKANTVSQDVIEEWNRLLIPAERFDTLISLGVNVVNHEVLDDVDLIRGSLRDKPRMDLAGLTEQLGQIESIINSLLADKLNDARLLALEESLARIKKLREKNLSPESGTKNKDQIKTMLELAEERTKRLHDI